MKRFSFIILFIISFFIYCNSTVFAEVESPMVQNESVSQEKVQESLPVVNEVPETIPEKNYENLKKIKDSKAYSKTIKFLVNIFIALLALLGAFGIYKFYTKRKNKTVIVDGTPKETLLTPNDLKSAINLFLGKTDE